MKNYILNFDASSFPVAVRVMPGRGVPHTLDFHSHDFSEIAIVVSGNITHEFTNSSNRLSAGDFLLLLPGVLHGWSEPDENALVYNILYSSDLRLPQLMYIKNEFIQQMYYDTASDPEQYAGIVRHLDKEEIPELLYFLNLISDEEKNNRPGRSAALAALFSLVVLQLARTEKEQASPERNWALGKVFRYLKDRFSEPVTIATLARQAGMSQSTLYRRFQEEFGIGPMEYVQNSRLARAAALLQTTPLTNEEIAQQCGFYNYSYMWKIFHKYLHISPSAIRSADSTDENISAFIKKYYIRSDLK